MKNRISIAHVILAFLSDDHYSIAVEGPHARHDGDRTVRQAKSDYWSKLYQQEEKRRPIEINLAKLHSWEYPPESRSFFQTLAAWLLFHLDTFRPGEKEPVRGLSDNPSGRLDWSLEVDREQLHDLLVKRGLPLPKGLWPEEESGESAEQTTPPPEPRFDLVGYIKNRKTDGATVKQLIVELRDLHDVPFAVIGKELDLGFMRNGKERNALHNRVKGLYEKEKITHIVTPDVK